MFSGAPSSVPRIKEQSIATIATPSANPPKIAKQFINRLPVDNVLSKLLPPSLGDSNVKSYPDNTRYDDFLEEAFANTLLTKTKGAVSNKNKVTKSDKIEEMEEMDKVENQANLDLVEGINLMNTKNETLDQVLDEVLEQNCLVNATEAT